ncbi:MAG: lipid-A-disaccharide synthase [Bacteriovoracaceae bacterium]|nr:lipid-A-disaccharide synthase [Bacteriovoracaceae bacterium]
MKSNCLIVVGEKSGEELCLNFFKQLKANCPAVHFWGVGGDILEQEGMELLYHLKDFSNWGVSEVIGKLPFYYKALKTLEAEVKSRECKVAILVDFQSFNLKLARSLKACGVSVLYYVAPKAWAWKAGRAKTLAQVVHTLFTIVPFEKQWFEDRGVQRVQSVTHPLYLGLSDTQVKSDYQKGNKVNILLLPGSRRSEVKSLIPIFFQTVKSLADGFDIQILLVKSSNVPPSYYADYESLAHQVFGDEQLKDALRQADFAIAASGTVTLATAIGQIPTVVAHRVSLLNEFLFNSFVEYEGPFALTNIVHQKIVFPELIQAKCSSLNIKKELLRWLTDKNEYDKIKAVLSKTLELIRVESFSVPEYMAQVIRESYKR